MTDNMSSSTISITILGATGAVGSAVLQAIKKEPKISLVRVITRRPIQHLAEGIPENQRPLIQQEIVEDFEKLPEHKDSFGSDAVVCALGTTRRKAGKEGFIKIDRDLILSVAKLAKENGCKNFHLVSSARANKDSYFLYTKIKGFVDDEVSKMGFQHVSIYRPGLLLGHREESRFFESIAQAIIRPLDRWRMFSIDIPKLSAFIVKNVVKNLEEKTSGIEILEHKELVDSSSSL